MGNRFHGPTASPPLAGRGRRGLEGIGWGCDDNSGNSSDSCYWGKVPQENLVGPALMVYWPFSPHGGFIR